jgi:hypothetical protein
MFVFDRILQNAVTEGNGGGANLAPVREGGSPLSINQGAAAIEGLLTDGEQENDLDDVEESEEPSGNQPTVETDDTVEADDDLQSDDEDDSQGTDDDENVAPIKTLADLAEALDVDIDELNNLQDTFNASGEEVTVTLADLRRGHQKDADYRRKTQEIAERKRQFEAVEAQRAQHYEANLVQIGQVLTQGQNLLLGELDSAEMQELRHTNPAEWTARRQELQARIDAVKQLSAQASQQYDAFQAQQQQLMAQQFAEMRETGLAQLRESIPEWGSELRDKLVSYLGDSYGYTAEDLSQVYDHRLLTIAHKARLYDEMQAVSAKTKKTLSTIPKSQKPNAAKGKTVTKKQTNITRAKKRLKSTGSLKDAANVISQLDL